MKEAGFLPQRTRAVSKQSASAASRVSHELALIREAHMNEAGCLTVMVKLSYRVWRARDAPAFADRPERSAEDTKAISPVGLSMIFVGCSSVIANVTPSL
jgi:hypothetical protein